MVPNEKALLADLEPSSILLSTSRVPWQAGHQSRLMPWTFAPTGQHLKNKLQNPNIQEPLDPRITFMQCQSGPSEGMAIKAKYERRLERLSSINRSILTHLPLRT